MINIAILGTGKIIPEAIDAMKASKKFHVANIWARPHSRDKAAALAEKFHVDKFTTDLDEILNDPSIDFVYVGLINAVHHEYADVIQRAFLRLTLFHGKEQRYRDQVSKRSCPPSAPRRKRRSRR